MDAAHRASVLMLAAVALSAMACGQAPPTRNVGASAGGAAGTGVPAPRTVRVDAGGIDGGRDIADVEVAPVCPAVLSRPRIQGCDGLLLTDPAAVDAASARIAPAPGPSGAQATRVGDGESIDVRDVGCYQLGKAGADFSLSMWLKASGGAQIIGTTSQYSGRQGFVLYTEVRPDGKLELRAFSSATGQPRLTVISAPFRANDWAFVVLLYKNEGDQSVFTVQVNMEVRSGAAQPDVYNERLRIGDEGFGTIAPFDVSELTSYARQLSEEEVKALFLERAGAAGVSVGELSGALDQLEAHLSGAAPLDEIALATQAARFAWSAAFLDRDPAVMKRALGLIGLYESKVGPLFMTPATANGVPRVGKAGDGLALARAMISIQQVVLDQVYSAANVAACRLFLTGTRYLTADYFPGASPPPSDPGKSYDVTILADAPAFWGRPVAFATEPVRRPTGLYLSPGSVAKVTVPQSMVESDFAVLVGAHTADHAEKATHKRLDRVSRLFPITRKVTYVANPLGGGIYINVPYLARLGQVTVQVQGVVEAPFFSLRSFDKTQKLQWQERRTAPGPWADFETDKFMMQVPRSWIYAVDDPSTFLATWDKAMDGVSELFGYPPEKRNRTVLYQQVDVQIRYGANGIGYPQINNTYDPRGRESGNKDHWLLRDPLKFEVDYHELGHAQLFTKFRGEVEAAVNFPHAYVRNVKFGVDFDTAFQQSFGPSYGAVGFRPDDAAINWMVTENFRNGREMDYSNTTKDEFRYQQRGYAKYGDVYRIFGWQPLRDFFHQEHLDYMSGKPSDGLDPVDSRILRMSVAAGEDLTPLIHFWGIRPVAPVVLKARLQMLGIPPSMKVRNHIERYKLIAPASNQQFNEHFERVYPGRPAGGEPDFGVGWYNVWRDKYGPAEAAQVKKAIQDIVTLYYGP